jgi:hypothetical protein
MAHGKNAAQKGHPGQEYWASRLHPHGELPGRFTKVRTHRKERRLVHVSIHRPGDEGADA